MCIYIYIYIYIYSYIIWGLTLLFYDHPFYVILALYYDQPFTLYLYGPYTAIGYSMIDQLPFSLFFSVCSSFPFSFLVILSCPFGRSVVPFMLPPSLMLFVNEEWQCDPNFMCTLYFLFLDDFYHYPFGFNKELKSNMECLITQVACFSPTV